MVCDKLRSGLDLNCLVLSRKYVQKIVLINKSDVEFSRIVAPYTNIENEYICENRIYFKLYAGLKGFAFKTNENSSQLFPTFDKSEIENTPQYSHSVNIIIAGVTEEIKCLLMQLDKGDYFAVAQFYDGTIEVFGFEFGLSTNNYNYDPHNSSGGAIIRLTSSSDAMEDYPPFVYKSTEGNEQVDFDNDFEDVILDENGDFNDDFSNDFNNQS